MKQNYITVFFRGKVYRKNFNFEIFTTETNTISSGAERSDSDTLYYTVTGFASPENLEAP